MNTSEAIERMMNDDESAMVVRPEVSGLEAITRSEVAMQLDAAHRYPRSVNRFLRDAASLATLSVEIAESCCYAVPRDGKMITGPSVRLAEMIASSWGNLHVGSRIVDVGEREVTAQAVAWDLERNVRITVEVPRNILTRNGKRFGDSMIQTTCAAAASVALRNAVFRVVPKAYVQAIYDKAKACAIGDAETLVDRRDNAFARFAKMGVTPERMQAKLGIKGPDDFTLEHLELLIGMHSAIKSGELAVDDAFPPVAPATAPSPVPAGTPEGRRAKPAATKTKGAAAPVTDAPEAPPPAVKAPAAAPVDIVELHTHLAHVDPEGYGSNSARAVIEAWTTLQQAEALTWAKALRYDGPFAIQSRRPLHTIMTAEVIT